MRQVLFLFFFVMSGLCRSQARLTIHAELNRPDAGGMLYVALCPGSEAYEKERGCRLLKGVAEGKEVLITVDDLPEGRYAAKAFHDVNGNGKMDLNWMGIPKEPYAFSNDAMGSMGPPRYEQAAFTVGKGPNAIRFRMRG